MELRRAAACCLAGTLGLGVPLAFASPAFAGGGCHAAYDEGQTEDSGDTVLLSGNCMSPTVLHTSVGSTVRFVNVDEVAHNLYGAGWGTDVVKPGLEFTETFDEEGAFPYACTIHPGMVGVVEVGGGSSVATQPVAATSDASDSDGGLAAGGIAAVAAVAFGAGAGTVALRRRRT